MTDIAHLGFEVDSDGSIQKGVNNLNELATAAGKAEGAVGRLGKASSRSGTSKVAAAAQSSVDALRRQLAAMERANREYGKTRMELLKLSEAYQQLTMAEQINAQQTVRAAEARERIGGMINAVLTPMQKYEQQLRDISTLEGRSGATAKQLATARANAAAQLRSSLGVQERYESQERQIQRQLEETREAYRAGGLSVGQYKGRIQELMGELHAEKIAFGEATEAARKHQAALNAQRDVNRMVGPSGDRRANELAQMRRDAIAVWGDTSDAATSANRKIQRSVRATRKEVGLLRRSLGSLGSVFKHAVGGIIAFGAIAGVAQFVRSITEANQAYASLIYTIRTATGSMAQAKKDFQFLADLSQKFGLDLQNLGDAYARLAVSAHAAGISSAELNKSFEGLAMAFTATHRTGAEVNRFLVQLEQGLSLGKIQMRDLRAMSQSMPAIWDMMGKAARRMGHSLQWFLENGGLPAVETLKALSAVAKNEFSEAAKKAADSFVAATNRIKATLFELKNSGDFASTLADALNELNAALQTQEGRQAFIHFIDVIGKGFAAVLKLTAFLVKHIDGITMAFKGLAIIIGAKYFASLMGGVSKAVGGITRLGGVVKRMGVRWTAAAVAVRGFGVALNLLGGWVGIAAIAFGVLWHAVSEYQSQLTKAERIQRDFQNNIRQTENVIGALSKARGENIKGLIEEAKAIRTNNLAKMAGLRIMQKLHEQEALAAKGQLAEMNTSPRRLAMNPKLQATVAHLRGELHRAQKAALAAKSALEGLRDENNKVSDSILHAMMRLNEYEHGLEVADNKASELSDTLSSSVETLSEYERLMARISERSQGYRDQLAGLTQAQITYREEIQKLIALFAGGDIGVGQMMEGLAAATKEFGLAGQANGGKTNILARIRAQTRFNMALAGTGRIQHRVSRIVRRAVAQWKRLTPEIEQTAEALEKFKKNAKDAASGFVLSEVVGNAFQPSQFEAVGQTIDFLRDKIKGLGEDIKEALNAGDSSLAEQLQDKLGGAKDALGQYNDELDRLKGQQMASIFGLASQAVLGMRQMVEKGSKAFHELTIAANGLAIAQAVLAVLNQGKGEPYSAWARMAAMAATVIPLLANIGQSISAIGGSGFTDTAAQRQATQGTGSVLGDAQAKSESIANATEITASATEKLVSINRGMLKALQALQAGIGGASVMLARGAGDIKIDSSMFSIEGSKDWMIDLMGGFFSGGGSFLGGFGDWLGDLGQKIWGGSTEITDKGIKIIGGTITDMIEDIMIGAYQEIQSKSWAFGSVHTEEAFKDLDGALAKQFTLILQSIVTTVTEAAKALGIPLEDIKARIEAFTIATQHISLKDLTAEEKKAELLAVFSKIFDNLAAAVVPFIDQFQKVGEGLAETLVRVATDVQVMREAIRRLGLTVGEMGVEAFAQMSVAMAEAAGGIDKFIQGMKGFVQAFAPDEFIQKLTKESLEKALGAVGLALPDTRGAMWELMRSLDATTEAGREQIATLLRVAALADKYYSALEDGANSAAEAIKKQIQATNDYVLTVSQLKQELGANPLADDIAGIAQWAKQTIASLNSLAKAAGRAGAAEEDLALVHQVAAQRMQAAISALHQESLGLIEKLYGDGGATSAVRNFGSAIESTAQKAKKSIDLLLGDLSPYTDRKKLQMALEGQRKGIVTPEQVLRIGRRLFSSGADYRNLFEKVMGIGDRTSAGTLNDSVTSRGVVDIAEKTLSKAERYGLSDKLANNIADLAAAQGLSFEQVAKNLGLDLAKLGKDLGLDAKALQEYLTVLASDNFGLTDLEGILANQVDRIITALGGDPMTSDGMKAALTPERAPDPYGNPPEPIQGHRAPPRAPDPYGRPAQDDGTRAELASLRAQIAELLERIANNTEGTRDGVKDLGDGIVDRDLVHNTRPTRA